MDAYQEIRKGERGAWVSIFAYIVLSCFKIVCGHVLASSALVADGFNNATDIVATVAILIGLRISQKPPDKDHAYGHFRAETIGALVSSFIMALIGAQIFIEATKAWFEHSQKIPNLWSAVVALVCAFIMWVVYIYNYRLAKKINSQALMAAAQHNVWDAWISIGAAAGIVGSQFGMPWLDNVAAMGVSVMIVKTAWVIFSDCTYRLTDGYDQSKLAEMISMLALIPGVKDVKDVKARIHGKYVFLDVVIKVDSCLTLIEGHEICDQIENTLKKNHNIMHVHIHVEPV